MPTKDNRVEPVPQVDEPPKVKLPKWFPFLLAGLAAIVLFFFVSSNFSREGDGIPAIRNDEEQRVVFEKLRTMSEDELQKWALGEPLTPLDIERLKKASLLAEGLVLYNSNDFYANMIAGQILYVLDDDANALERLQKAISVGQASKSPRADLQQNIAQAYYVSSLALFDMKRYGDAAQQANFAFLMVPQSADYATAVASAAIQLNELEQAKKFLREALRLDPRNKRANQLKKLIKL